MTDELDALRDTAFDLGLLKKNNRDLQAENERLHAEAAATRVIIQSWLDQPSWDDDPEKAESESEVLVEQAKKFLASDSGRALLAELRSWRLHGLNLAEAIDKATGKIGDHSFKGGLEDIAKMGEEIRRLRDDLEIAEPAKSVYIKHLVNERDALKLDIARIIGSNSVDAVIAERDALRIEVERLLNGQRELEAAFVKTCRAWTCPDEAEKLKAVVEAARSIHAREETGNEVTSSRRLEEALAALDKVKS